MDKNYTAQHQEKQNGDDKKINTFVFHNIYECVRWRVYLK